MNDTRNYYVEDYPRPRQSIQNIVSNVIWRFELFSYFYIWNLGVGINRAHKTRQQRMK